MENKETIQTFGLEALAFAKDPREVNLRVPQKHFGNYSTLRQFKLLMVWYPDQSHTNPTAKYAHHSNRTTPTHIPQKPNQINLLVIWNQNRTEPHHTKPYSSSQTNELPRAFGASMDRTARGASGCSPSPSFCSYRERIGSSGLKSRPNRPNLIFQ